MSGQLPAPSPTHGGRGLPRHQACHDTAWQSWVCFAMAQHSMAWQSWVWHMLPGLAWHSTAQHCITQSGLARNGMAWHGRAGSGMHCMVWHGTAQHGMARHGRTRSGLPQNGMAWHGMAELGLVWHGMAWHGRGGSCLAQNGMAWYGMAWHGRAGSGMRCVPWHGTAWHGLARVPGPRAPPRGDQGALPARGTLRGAGLVHPAPTMSGCHGTPAPSNVPRFHPTAAPSTPLAPPAAPPPDPRAWGPILRHGPPSAPPAAAAPCPGPRRRGTPPRCAAQPCPATRTAAGDGEGPWGRGGQGGPRPQPCPHLCPCMPDTSALPGCQDSCVPGGTGTLTPALCSPMARSGAGTRRGPQGGPGHRAGGCSSPIPTEGNVAVGMSQRGRTRARLAPLPPALQPHQPQCLPSPASPPPKAASWPYSPASPTSLQSRTPAQPCCPASPTAGPTARSSLSPCPGTTTVAPRPLTPLSEDRKVTQVGGQAHMWGVWLSGPPAPHLHGLLVAHGGLELLLEAGVPLRPHLVQAVPGGVELRQGARVSGTARGAEHGGQRHRAGH